MAFCNEREEKNQKNEDQEEVNDFEKKGSLGKATARKLPQIVSRSLKYFLSGFYDRHPSES